MENHATAKENGAAEAGRILLAFNSSCVEVNDVPYWDTWPLRVIVQTSREIWRATGMSPLPSSGNSD